MTLHQAACHNPDDAQVPLWMMQDQGMTFLPGKESVRLGKGFFLRFPIQCPSLLIEPFELPGPGSCFDLVVSQKEVDGACSIADFRTIAEDMGYKVLVAEGSPIVLKIIVSGYVDAIVGVACLNVLEKAIDKDRFKPLVKEEDAV